MNRRHFINKSLLAAAVSGSGLSLSAASVNEFNQVRRTSQRLLNAYYFRAHTYTCVPHQIREDMKRMADAGTNIVSVGVLEQDLYAAVENIAIICDEAEKAGMQVYAVPSRWGGIVAGAPKVPSFFTIMNEDTWIKDKDGNYVRSGVSGRISSVAHPKTLEFFKDSLTKLFSLWPVKGIIWDEPKSIMPDYSAGMIAKYGNEPTWEQVLQANVDFFSRINQHIKSIREEVQTCLFAYAQLEDNTVNALASIDNLDFFGCDGRPWPDGEGKQDESRGKVLLGNGERFLKAAHDNNKKSLWLIENHNMLDEDASVMDKFMPEIISKPVDHLIYYYYPRNIQSPDMLMDIIFKHVAAF